MHKKQWILWKDLLGSWSKDLDALIFQVGQCTLVLVYAWKIILATAVLHNMCIFDNTQFPETVGPFDGDDDGHEEVYHEPPSALFETY